MFKSQLQLFSPSHPLLPYCFRSGHSQRKRILPSLRLTQPSNMLQSQSSLRLKTEGRMA